MIFWWTGKGYLTMVILLATMVVFGVLLSATSAVFHGGTAFWGFVVIVAAGLNWAAGSRINRKRRAIGSGSFLSRQFYRGGHRFMSMPMETFSFVLPAAT